MSFPTLVAPAVITVPEGHNPCLHTPPVVWGTFPGPGSSDRGSLGDRDLESSKRALKRRGCPPWEPGGHREVSLGLPILSSTGTGLHPPSPGRPDRAPVSGQGGSMHSGFPTCLLSSASQPGDAAEPGRGAAEALVAILKFPIREELVMGGREGWGACPSPAVCD